MRILHIMDYYVPNLGYQENYLPFIQRELGHEVGIITSNFIPKKRRIYTKNFKKEKNEFIHNNVKIYRLKSWFSIEKMGRTVIKNLANKIKEFNPDVIHSHGLYTYGSIISLKIVKKTNIKLFIDIHIDNDNFHPDGLFKKTYIWLFNRFFLEDLKKYTILFLPVNPFAKKYLINNLGINQSKVQLLPLGVDGLKFFPNNKKIKKIRNELNLKKKDFVIISSGMFNNNKDIDILVQSIYKLSQNHSNIKLLLLGSGPNEYMTKIGNLVNIYKLENKVIFHDFIEHSILSDYYNASDLGVFPGKLGITTIEAVATGLPVIVCKNDATEFIIQNNNGLSFKRGDVEELTQKIREYINNPTKRKKHKQNAVQLVENKLSWKKIAERSIEIYRE